MSLKLHPVSQEFELDDPRVVRLFGMAAEIDLPVLIHAGFAMQRIVEPLLPTVEAYPGLRLILGHCAMVEVLSATMPSRTTERAVRDLRCAGQRPVRALLLRRSFPDLLRVGHTLWRPAVDVAFHPRCGRGCGVPDAALPGILSENIKAVVSLKAASRADSALRTAHLLQDRQLHGHRDPRDVDGEPEGRHHARHGRSKPAGWEPRRQGRRTDREATRPRQGGREYLAGGDFSVAMGRMRVAHDLLSLHIIRLSNE